MPELPEVETVRRGLAPVMVGRRLARVEQRRADLRFPFPDRFVERTEGRRIEQLRRRSKYLLADLDSGETLIMHLGMSGRFTISEPGGANGRMLGEYEHEAGHLAKHDHVVFHTDRGATIIYNDARRFGFMDLVTTAEIGAHSAFDGLGIEPLDGELTPDFLAAAAHGKKTDLKAFLLDQRIVCGLGNIYVCEALFRSRLAPTAKANRIATRSGKPTDETRLLVDNIKMVLEAAIHAGGSTLRDHQQVDGTLGYFQHSFQVYGREDDPCVTPGCGGIIKRIVQSGRSTFLCPKCQGKRR